jgi:hypothetical protein
VDSVNDVNNINNVDNVDDIHPTPTPPGLAELAAASRTVQPLDLGPMNIECNNCNARH